MSISTIRGDEWEGFETATRAAAGGGVTTLVDMPLNCVPETINVDALEAKRAAADGNAWVDWAAWGGVVRGNAAELPALAKAGVPGFKCFLIHSGIDGFAWVDESDLRSALERLRGTGLPLLVHAEVAGPVGCGNQRTQHEQVQTGAICDLSCFAARRCEVEAIALLIRLAEEFHTPIHVVHLSSAKALPMLAEARSHAAYLSRSRLVRTISRLTRRRFPMAPREFKCAPPIRNAANREQLWKALESGLD